MKLNTGSDPASKGQTQDQISLIWTPQPPNSTQHSHAQLQHYKSCVTSNLFVWAKDAYARCKYASCRRVCSAALCVWPGRSRDECCSGCKSRLNAPSCSFWRFERGARQLPADPLSSPPASEKAPRASWCLSEHQRPWARCTIMCLSRSVLSVIWLGRAQFY